MTDHEPAECELGARVELLERQVRGFVIEFAQIHAELRELKHETNSKLGQIGGELVHVMSCLSRIETKLNTAIMDLG